MTIDELIDEKILELRRMGLMHENQVRAALLDVAKRAGEIVEPFVFEGRGPFIQLWKSQTRFHPFDCQPEDIHIEDIAWGLATECRFGGHCPFYTVAEHSIYVSQLMEGFAYPESIDRQLIGLLHDAAEAYLKDIPRPIKHTPAFAAYRELEKKIQDVIYRSFQLDHALEASEQFLKWADSTMLATEKIELFPEGHASNVMDGCLPPPQRMRLAKYIPQIAYNQFMAHYSNLIAARAL
jgi:hypothetical protein